MKTLRRSAPRGFTIVELLVVIVIIGILAAVVIVAYTGVTARAQYTIMRQDFNDIRKSIELYRIDHSGYPNSADCASTSGEYNYQNQWCGWDQGQGDSFIPGLTPTYIAKLPTLNRSLPQLDTYVYQSRASNGIDPGTDQYQLIRFKAVSLGGLTSAEKANDADVLRGGDGGYTGEEAWGYRSEPTAVWW